MDVQKICVGCMRELEKPGICPNCGYNPADVSAEGHYLRPYTILNGKYLVGKVLGEGGFGITYIGYDLNLEMPVAIKEFYPNGFVTRESSVTSVISMYKGTNLEMVQKWKNNFIKEARTLARCSNLSGIVGVKDFFEENGTAYIAMEYLSGMTLKTYAQSHGGKLEPNQLLKSLEPVMTSLTQLHDYGLIHRDISPDNIMLLPGGQMKLLDFGAARDFAGGDEKSLSVMLKPGYAPEEQYRTKGKQGPWSDVYAFAATIYKCITGVTPPESMERMRQDELKKPSELGVFLNPQAEQAILKGMAVYAENRYQSMREFMASLYAGNQPVQQVQQIPSSQTITQTQTNMQVTGYGTENVVNNTNQTNTGAAVDQWIEKLKKNWKIVAAVAAGVLIIVLLTSVPGKDRVVDSNTAPAASVSEIDQPAEDPDTESVEASFDQDEEMQALAEENIARGKELLEEGDYDTAILYFSEALNAGAVNNEEIYMLSSDAYLGKGDIINAITMLDMGIEQTGMDTLRTRKQYLCDHTKVTKMEQYSNGILLQLEEYDTDGNILKEERYDGSGKMKEWGVYTYWSGQLSYEEHYYPNGDLKSSMSYDNGLEFEFYSYDDQGVEQEHSIYQYSDGVLFRQNYYDRKGNLSWWKDYEHDQNGRVSRDISYNLNGNVNSWQDYRYDANGNVIYTAGYYSDGSINASATYEYDEYGNMTKMENYDENGNFIWGNWYGYEYDAIGNPSKQFVYNHDSSEVTEERRYEYTYQYMNY